MGFLLKATSPRCSTRAWSRPKRCLNPPMRFRTAHLGMLHSAIMSKHIAAKVEAAAAATRTDPVLALCEYWLAAEFMRRQTHAIKDKWARARTRHWSEFRTYHSYWLSALYVVVEDFEKLGLDKKMCLR